MSRARAAFLLGGLPLVAAAATPPVEPEGEAAVELVAPSVRLGTRGGEASGPVALRIGEDRIVAEGARWERATGRIVLGPGRLEHAGATLAFGGAVLDGRTGALSLADIRLESGPWEVTALRARGRVGEEAGWRLSGARLSTCGCDGEPWRLEAADAWLAPERVELRGAAFQLAALRLPLPPLAVPLEPPRVRPGLPEFAWIDARPAVRERVTVAAGSARLAAVAGAWRGPEFELEAAEAGRWARAGVAWEAEPGLQAWAGAAGEAELLGASVRVGGTVVNGPAAWDRVAPGALERLAGWSRAWAGLERGPIRLEAPLWQEVGGEAAVSPRAGLVAPSFRLGGGTGAAEGFAEVVEGVGRLQARGGWWRSGRAGVLEGEVRSEFRALGEAGGEALDGRAGAELALPVWWRGPLGRGEAVLRAAGDLGGRLGAAPWRVPGDGPPPRWRAQVGASGFTTAGVLLLRAEVLAGRSATGRGATVAASLEGGGLRVDGAGTWGDPQVAEEGSLWMPRSAGEADRWRLGLAHGGRDAWAGWALRRLEAGWSWASAGGFGRPLGTGRLEAVGRLRAAPDPTDLELGLRWFEAGCLEVGGWAGWALDRRGLSGGLAVRLGTAAGGTPAAAGRTLPGGEGS